MTPEEAIKIVARDMAARAIESFVDDDIWEPYPEVGEDDFESIVYTANALVAYPSATDLAEAIEVLKGRVDAQV